jgi:hypothetical protein
MEDWQDEVSEQDLILRAEEEEKRIKAAKLEAIRLEEEQYQKSRRSVDLSRQSREVVQPAVQELLHQQQVEAEIARLKEEGGPGSLAPHMSTGEERVEKPLLRKIATLTGDAPTKQPAAAPVPAPRRDSRATPVQKPAVAPGQAASGTAEPEPLKAEALKARNPKLANMMAMIGTEDSKGGLFADQTMTPEVTRHKTTTVMSQTNAEIEKREHQK